jgi:hypothetical protein
MAFPFFWLVVWSGFDFPVSYMFDWLLLTIGLAYSALAEIVPRKRPATPKALRQKATLWRT